MCSEIGCAPVCLTVVLWNIFCELNSAIGHGNRADGNWFWMIWTMLHGEFSVKWLWFYDELWRIVSEIEQAPGPDVTADSHIKFASRQDHALTIIVLATEPSLL